MKNLAVKCKTIWPGLGIATITGMAALFLSEHYNAPAMLFALLLGMAVSFLYQNNTQCKCGIDFASNSILIVRGTRALLPKGENHGRDTLLTVVAVIKQSHRANLRAGNQDMPKVPVFLIGFVFLMFLNSFVALPEVVTDIGTQISRFFLVISITAIGMKSNLAQLAEVGILPIVMIVLETVWIALLILGYLFVI